MKKPALLRLSSVCFYWQGPFSRFFVSCERWCFLGVDFRFFASAGICRGPMWVGPLRPPPTKERGVLPLPPLSLESLTPRKDAFPEAWLRLGSGTFHLWGPISRFAAYSPKARKRAGRKSSLYTLSTSLSYSGEGSVATSARVRHLGPLCQLPEGTVLCRGWIPKEGGPACPFLW
jgi:hypothetical protein